MENTPVLQPPVELPQPSPIPRVEQPQQPAAPKKRRFTLTVLLAILLIGLIAGGLVGFALTYSALNTRLNIIEGQLGLSTSNSGGSSVFYLGDNVSLSALYENIKPSVVVITDLVLQQNFFVKYYNQQQGSGFVTEVNNQQVIVTNNHVVSGAVNFTVTFANGDSYSAKVLGSDAKADLAVLQVTSMPTGLKSLTLGNSESLNVGDPVVAVGSPYGLSGTLTTGVISALGRTITEDNDQTIADIIQTSTAINPGNSGGPLVTYDGTVIGITTAGISDSQGLGFAIPSATIIRELASLVSSGSYTQHPSINTVGTDMNLQIAQAMGTTTTYGYLVENTQTNNGLKGGNQQINYLGYPIIIGGDIIVAVNDQRITNSDALLSYLEQHTLPGQTVDFTVVRGGQTQAVHVTIGTA